MIQLTDTHILVHLPEGAKNLYINGYYSHLCFQEEYSVNINTIPLPPCQWSILCSIDEVTEEVAKTFLRFQYVPTGVPGTPEWSKETRWLNYLTNRLDLFSWQESFASLVESKGWYLKNPYGEAPKMWLSPPIKGRMGSGQRNPEWKQWSEAEAQTIKNGVLLGKQ